MSSGERDWQNLREMMDYLLQDATRPGVGTAGVVWQPPTDAYETEAEFVVRIDVSGVRRDDLRINVDGDRLVVRGLRRDNMPSGRKHFYKMEIVVGPFERALPLPRNVDTSEIEANYRDGILEIRCPKRDGGAHGEIKIEIL